MASINTVCISGNVTRDAELRMTAGGMGVLTFTVAVNESRKNDAGQWEEVASFVDCTLFGKRAEALRTMLTKGAGVTVSGRLHMDRWTDKQTSAPRSKLGVVVNEVALHGRREARDGASAVTAAAASYGAQGGSYGAPTWSDEDIPF